MRRRWLGNIGWMAVGMMALAVSSVGAEGPGGRPGEHSDRNSTAKAPTLASLVEELSSAKYRVREEATVGLMRMPAVRLSEVENLLAREGDPEVISRLTQVAVHLMLKGRAPLNGPVGLLGITLAIEPWEVAGRAAKAEATEGGASAVVVTGIQVGFPAAETLEVGDRIIAIDGHGFPDGYAFEDFRNLVRARQAGDVIRMRIVRDGRTLEVAVQVAGITDAEGVDMTDYLARRQRMVQNYLAELKTGAVGGPLVVKDDSPVEAEDGPENWEDHIPVLTR